MKKKIPAGLAPLSRVDSDRQKVRDELAGRLEKLKDEGFADCKGLASTSRDSNPEERIWVLNNVLRLDELGLCETTVINP